MCILLKYQPMRIPSGRALSPGPGALALVPIIAWQRFELRFSMEYKSLHVEDKNKYTETQKNTHNELISSSGDLISLSLFNLPSLAKCSV